MADREKVRTSRLTLLVLAVLLIIVTAELIRLRTQIAEATETQAALEAQLAAQKQENASLEAAIGKTEDTEYLQELARNELGYVTPGEKDFFDISSK